jgi:uncharacterized integral membrane protein
LISRVAYGADIAIVDKGKKDKSAVFKFSAKFLVYLLLCCGLVAISFLPIDVASVSFAYDSLSVSIPLNIFVASVVASILVGSCIFAVVRFVRSVLSGDKEKLDKYSQNSLISMMFSKASVTDPMRFKISDKYRPLKEAVVCLLSEMYCILPPFLFNLSCEKNELLFIRKAKINIQKLLKDNNMEEAVELAKTIINSYPKGVGLIINQIINLSGHCAFSFDPRKFKYELSPNDVTRYYLAIAMREYRESSDIAALEKYNGLFPGNVKIASILINHYQNSKKALSIVKDGFAAVHDREFAYLLPKSEDVIDQAEDIVSCASENNIERLWFLCIVATENNLTSKAAERLNAVISSSECSIDEVIKFCFLNYSKFANNIDLLKCVKGSARK